MTRPQDATVLKRARALLEEHWGQGSFYSERFQTYCALGAVFTVTSTSKDAVDRANGYNNKWGLNIVERYLRKVVPSKYAGAIVSFNDDHQTKKEDVLAMFDRAIALAEAQKS